MSRKNIFLTILVWSIFLMVLFSKPRVVNWFEYGEARYYIMWASWLIGMVIMTRQVILWIRPMFARFTKDFFRVNWLHKRLGIWTMMSLIFHPIASVISYGTSWMYMFSLDFSDVTEWWISVGKIAFDLILIVLVTSVISRKFLSYRSWHWIHLLSYPAFIWVWFHGWFTGTMIAELPAMRWYRIAIGGILVVAMIVRIAYQFWYLKRRSSVISHTNLTKDIRELEIQMPHSIPYSEWQFVYIQAKKWWESHPFTILSYDDETQIMRIAYKIYGKFTQELSQIVSWSVLYIDGPYWVFMDDVKTLQVPIVCIAAGIWITPFYQIIQNYASTKDIKLFYLNKTKHDIVYEDELESHLPCEWCFHVLSREHHQEKNNYIIDTRITKDILAHSLWDILWSARFYLCGWGAVITEVTKMLHELWVPSDHIEFEPFTM